MPPVYDDVDDDAPPPPKPKAAPAIVTATRFGCGGSRRARARRGALAWLRARVGRGGSRRSRDAVVPVSRERAIGEVSMM